MKEIEILVEVFTPKDTVLNILERFENVGIKKVTDNYFFDPLRTDLKPNDKGNLTRCFRLRKKGEKQLLAYKIDHFDEKGIWTYSDEHEVEVSSFEEALKIVEHLGLKPLITIENEKHTFITDKYEIVLEDVKNLGLFMEVENLDTDDERPVDVIKKEIWDFINNLGIKTSEECIYGKPELMLKKHPVVLLN